MPVKTVTATLLICLIAPTLAVAQTAGRGAQAVAAEPIFDAGRVAKGDKIRHRFTIANEGDALLEIREVRPACGCTVADFDETIAPGATGEIETVVDTDTFRGPIAKYVTVFTNDRNNPRIRLTVRAEIEPHVEVLPGYARFIHVAGSGPSSVAQTLWATGGVELELSDATSSLPFVAVELRRAEADERDPAGPETQWRLVTTLASNAPEGPINGSVTVTTNHPQQASLQLPVAGFVRPLILTTPARVDFGRFPATQPRKGSFLVTNYGSEPIALTEVTSDLPGLTAEIEEHAEGERFEVRLTLDPAGPLGPREGTVIVKTSSPRVPELAVQIRGQVE